MPEIKIKMNDIDRNFWQNVKKEKAFYYKSLIKKLFSKREKLKQ